ncbi:unnamed protein product [Pleuronectes platessa]|uniref:Uncharacterized protein n=1 Tax=Pleuronectes platessa TaxID=8262 RepID=A0A9N7U972_PLEPL|nr:unnamed protein product [Pleuronectes platessa]
MAEACGAERCSSATALCPLKESGMGRHSAAKAQESPLVVEKCPGFSQKPLLSSKPAHSDPFLTLNWLKASIIHDQLLKEEDLSEAGAQELARRSSITDFLSNPTAALPLFTPAEARDSFAEEHELHIPEEEGRRSSRRSSTSKSAVCPVQRPKTA